MINSHHHNTKHQLRQLLEKKGYHCYEEVFAVDSEGSQHFSDIFAFHNDDPRALIVDPTIRYETNDLDKASNVEYEKHQIYSKCVEYYEKYFPICGNKEYKVYGLLFGSRGTPSTSVINFFRTFQLDLKDLNDICLDILINSIHIINHHIYGN